MQHSSGPSGRTSARRPRRASAQAGRTTPRQPAGGRRGHPREAALAGAPAGVRKKGGRQPRRPSLWPRRIITGTGLLIVLACVVWALASAMSWVFSDPEPSVAPMSDAQSGDSEDLETPRMTADGILSPNNAVHVPNCTSEMLEIQSTAGNVHVGQALRSTVTATTHSNTACSSAAGMFGLVITSGDQLYYDSRQCEGHDASATPLLLSPTSSWSGELTWDARRYNGCSPIDNDGDGAGDLAEPGTYKVRIVYGEERTASEHVIEVLP